MNDATAQADRRIVEIATQELVRRKLNVPAYRSEVVRQDKMFVVIFTDAEIPEGSRGVQTENAALEVEVDRASLKIIRSYFVR